MDINKVNALLEKYQKGTCSVTEVNLIEDWLATVANKHEHITDDFIEGQLNITKSTIVSIISTPAIVHKQRYVWFSVAASVLIFVSASIFSIKNNQANKATVPQGISKHIIHGMVYIEIPKGLTYPIKLPDGSLITLNALSRLHYPVKFSNHNRLVYLDEGEALFDVAKDKTRPFTVFTTKFATTALGTSFNIRTYSNEHKVLISLIHGKIRVEDLQSGRRVGTSRLLLTHQQIVLNRLSGIVKKTNFRDETPITSWKDGILSFQDASMDQVINAIQNKYNITIKNNSSHTNWSYTGSFNNESLNDVLKTVCLTEGINCVVNKNSIVLN